MEYEPSRYERTKPALYTEDTYRGERKEEVKMSDGNRLQTIETDKVNQRLFVY